MQYRGLEWFNCRLPVKAESWPRRRNLRIGPDNDQDDHAPELVQTYARGKMWLWSGRRIYFVSDIHADADAFFLSLVASGGIAKTGPADADFELTPEGRNALFIIGGDCFDKGPLNLRLLDAIQHLYDKGAEVELLAGNHDIRTYLGIFYAENKETLLDHLFVRMGRKTVPLLKEIYDAFIRGANEQLSFDATDASLHAMLFPDESWYADFPVAAAALIPAEKLEKEVQRIREKSLEFEARAAEFGLTLAQVHAAVQKFRELFFEPKGRYHWFFDRMKLACQQGSYLFVHAGVDDTAALAIRDRGVAHLNEEFRRMLQEDPFALYHGVLGNMFRTKYRDIDYPLTPAGVEALHSAAIYAIVHGHRNLCQGQRMVVRAGMLNFECDASVDCNTRVIEDLHGPGGASVVFSETGRVQAISTDYPFVKSFHPGAIAVAAERG
ncbi:MAG: metallophosphoesterase [Pseudomonadota bacterium]